MFSSARLRPKLLCMLATLPPPSEVSPLSLSSYNSRRDHGDWWPTSRSLQLFQRLLRKGVVRNFEDRSARPAITLPPASGLVPLAVCNGIHSGIAHACPGDRQFVGATYSEAVGTFARSPQRGGSPTGASIFRQAERLGIGEQDCYNFTDKTAQDKTRIKTANLGESLGATVYSIRGRKRALATPQTPGPGGGHRLLFLLKLLLLFFL